MTFIIAIITIILGLMLFSFAVGNIVLVIAFAIPLTRKLERAHMLKSNNYIVRSYLVSLSIVTVTILAITAVSYLYLPDGPFISLMVGYGLGLVGIITKIKEFGLNMNNFSEYVQKNRPYFLEELVKLYDKDEQKLLALIKAGHR